MPPFIDGSITTAIPVFLKCGILPELEARSPDMKNRKDIRGKKYLKENTVGNALRFPPVKDIEALTVEFEFSNAIDYAYINRLHVHNILTQSNALPELILVAYSS